MYFDTMDWKPGNVLVKPFLTSPQYIAITFWVVYVSYRGISTIFHIYVSQRSMPVQNLSDSRVKALSTFGMLRRVEAQLC